MGKLFALTNIKEMSFYNEVVSPFHYVNLKCDPQIALELRSSHESIIPGWHMNKKHWNSLILDGSLTDQQIINLTNDSYDLVVESMTKKEQLKLKEL